MEPKEENSRIALSCYLPVCPKIYTARNRREDRWNPMKWTGPVGANPSRTRPGWQSRYITRFRLF